MDSDQVVSNKRNVSSESDVEFKIPTPFLEREGTGERIFFPKESYFSEPPLPRMMKVMDLRPKMNSIDITLKVVDVKIILKVPWIAESIVGDETGVIVLKTVRRDQAKRVRHGKTIRLRNARVEVPNGSMKLMVRRAEDIEDAPDAAFTVKLDNNLSLIEWDRIDVAV